MSHTDDGKLHAFLDGELASEEEAQLREHLSTCAACRARLDVERETRGQAHRILRLADPPAVVAPDFATLAARRSATLRGAPAGRRNGRAYLLPWAASVVLALAAGWFAQELLDGDGARGGDSAGGMVTAARMEEGTGSAESIAIGTEDAQDARDRVRAFSTGPATSHGREAGAEPAASAPGEEAGGPDPLSVVAAAEMADAGDQPIDRSLAAGVRHDADAAPQGAAAMAREAPAPSNAPAAARAAPETGWNAADRTAAARMLGTEPLAVEGVPIEAYSLGRDGRRILLVQRLPGGERLEVEQRVQPGGAAIPPSVSDGGTSEVAVVRGAILVVLRAPVAADSLSRLMERLR